MNKINIKYLVEECMSMLQVLTILEKLLNGLDMLLLLGIYVELFLLFSHFGFYFQEPINIIYGIRKNLKITQKIEKL